MKERKPAARAKVTRDPDYYRRIGQLGGQATRDKLGSEFYRKAGQLGGAAVKELYGPGYYSTIAKKRGQLKTEAPDAE